MEAGCWCQCKILAVLDRRTEKFRWVDADYLLICERKAHHECQRRCSVVDKGHLNEADGDIEPPVTYWTNFPPGQGPRMPYPQVKMPVSGLFVFSVETPSAWFVS
jgi:hypothetical protein